MSEIEKEVLDTDQYMEHSYHTVGENGKTVPFWKNMKVCSTCYEKHEAIAKKFKAGMGTNGRITNNNETNLSGNPEFAR